MSEPSIIEIPSSPGLPNGGAILGNGHRVVAEPATRHPPVGERPLRSSTTPGRDVERPYSLDQRVLQSYGGRRVTGLTTSGCLARAPESTDETCGANNTATNPANAASCIAETERDAGSVMITAAGAQKGKLREPRRFRIGHRGFPGLGRGLDEPAIDVGGSASIPGSWAMTLRRGTGPRKFC